MASFRTALLILPLLTLGACSGSLGDALGFGKRAPDEFAVVKRQPLIIPPDYTLRPPDPDAPRPLPARADAQARATLTGRPVGEGAATAAAATAGAASGEEVLVRRTTEIARDPAIRERLASEVGGPAEVDGALFEEIMAAPDGDPAEGPADARDVLTDPGASGAAEAPVVVDRTSTPLEDR